MLSFPVRAAKYAAIATVAMIGFVPTTIAQSGGAAPMSYYLVMLNALRDRPDLFSDETWNKLTAQQIIDAQSKFFSRAIQRGEMDPVFTAAQVKDRNPEMASAELAPVLKANLAERAKAAPDTLVAKHALLELRYDDKTGKLVSPCCYGRPRARPGLFDLLMPGIDLVSGVPSNTPAAYQPSPNLPQRARSLAVYRVKDNLGANEAGPVPALAAMISSGARFGFRPEEMDIALDRWAEIDGIPMARSAAEMLLNQIGRQQGKVTAHVTFVATGAEKGSHRAVLYGKLVSVAIVGPDGATIATFPAEAFPKAEAGSQALVSPQENSRKPAAASPAFDVVGLRLGVSPVVADAVLRAHMTVGWIYARERTGTAAATPYQAMKAYVAADLSEVVLVYFEPSTTEGKVVAVRRRSMIGQNVAAASLGAALLQKYGTPAVAKNDNWVWGNPGGCSASGTGVLSLRDLKLVAGSARSDKAFQQAVGSALDLATHDAVSPDRYASCGPVLHVLRDTRGVTTTLVDQKFATDNLGAKSGDPAPKIKL